MTVSHRWRKARASGEQTECIQLSHTTEALRDSKNPNGPVLNVDTSGLLRLARAFNASA